MAANSINYHSYGDVVNKSVGEIFHLDDALNTGSLDPHALFS